MSKADILEVKADIKTITKEVIVQNKKLEKCRVFLEKFDFLEVIFRNIVKAVIVLGMLFAYYRKDMLLMLLMIGTSVIALGYWQKRGG